MLEQYIPDISLGTNGPGMIVESLIQDVLSVLALVAVLMLIYSGLLMLMFGSDDEIRKKSLRSIFGVFIGLAIILSSKGVVGYILNTLNDATGSNVAPF